MSFNRYMLRTPKDLLYFDDKERLIDNIRAFLTVAERDPIPGFESCGLFVYAYEVVRGDKPCMHTDAEIIDVEPLPPLAGMLDFSYGEKTT